MAALYAPYNAKSGLASIDTARNEVRVQGARRNRQCVEQAVTDVGVVNLAVNFSEAVVTEFVLIK